MAASRIRGGAYGSAWQNSIIIGKQRDDGQTELSRARMVAPDDVVSETYDVRRRLLVFADNHEDCKKRKWMGIKATEEAARM